MTTTSTMNPALAALRAKALAAQASAPIAAVTNTNTPSEPITKLEPSSNVHTNSIETATNNISNSSNPGTNDISSSSNTTTAGAAAHIVARLNELSIALQTANPNISDNLRLIHRALLDDPEQVTLLTLEQRATFFQGLMKQTQVSISAVAAKTKQTSKKDLAQMSLDDLL